jgi:hypothetical protein
MGLKVEKELRMLMQMPLKLMRMIYRLVIVDVYLKNKKNMTSVPRRDLRRGMKVESDFWKLPSLLTCTSPYYLAMRLRTVLVAALGALLPFASSQAEESQTYKYEVSHLSLSSYCPPLTDLQSDISRLRSLVIHSLYSHKDVFLRELLSNANDALEKLRITALTDREVMSSGEANVTIEVKIDEDSGGKTGKIIVRGVSILHKGCLNGGLGRALGKRGADGRHRYWND